MKEVKVSLQRSIVYIKNSIIHFHNIFNLQHEGRRPFFQTNFARRLRDPKSLYASLNETSVIMTVLCSIESVIAHRLSPFKRKFPREPNFALLGNFSPQMTNYSTQLQWSS